MGICDIVIVGDCVYDKNCMGDVMDIDGVSYVILCTKFFYCFVFFVDVII